MQSKILWIEDDKKFLEVTIPLFVRFGLLIEGVTSARDGIYEFRRNSHMYSLILLDLNMGEMDGIETYFEIRKINSRVPIIFVSAYISEPRWRLQLDAITEEIEEIEKPLPMVTSKTFPKVIEIIKKKQTSYIEQQKINPFEYSLSDFLRQTKEEREEIFKLANDINSNFINKYFNDNSEKDWVVIARKKGNIIASGMSKDEPLQEDLRKLAEEVDAPVFTYSRPQIIEEVCTGWSLKTAPDDYYPTVLFEFNSGQLISCDFDTGSPLSYISHEELKEKKLIDELYWCSSSSMNLWGQTYYYYNHKLGCKLNGISNSVDITLRCHIVQRWDRSPLIKNFKNRVGLIGRNLLLENKLKLLLDGENKKTDIIV